MWCYGNFIPMNNSIRSLAKQNPFILLMYVIENKAFFLKKYRRRYMAMSSNGVHLHLDGINFKRPLIEG